MKDIETLRKIAYFKLEATYYQLQTNKEIEISCLNQNFNAFKIYKQLANKQKNQIDKENFQKLEYDMLNYCLRNVHEIKRLENEIKTAEKSLSKVNNKSDKKEKIKHDIKIENQQLIDEIHQIMANTYVEIEKVKKLEMKEN